MNSASTLPPQQKFSPVSFPDFESWSDWPDHRSLRRDLTMRKWSILTLYETGHFDVYEAIAQLERAGLLANYDPPDNPPDFEQFLEFFIASERAKANFSLNGGI